MPASTVADLLDDPINYLLGQTQVPLIGLLAGLNSLAGYLTIYSSPLPYPSHRPLVSGGAESSLLLLMVENNDREGELVV